MAIIFIAIIPVSRTPAPQPVNPVTNHNAQRVMDQVIDFKVTSFRHQLEGLNKQNTKLSFLSVPALSSRPLPGTHGRNFE